MPAQQILGNLLSTRITEEQGRWKLDSVAFGEPFGKLRQRNGVESEVCQALAPNPPGIRQHHQVLDQRLQYLAHLWRRIFARSRLHDGQHPAQPRALPGHHQVGRLRALQQSLEPLDPRSAIQGPLAAGLQVQLPRPVGREVHSALIPQRPLDCEHSRRRRQAGNAARHGAEKSVGHRVSARSEVSQDFCAGGKAAHEIQLRL